MAPFVQDEIDVRRSDDCDIDRADIDISKLDIEMISAQEIIKNIDCSDDSLFEEESGIFDVLKEKKLVMIGVAVSLICFSCLLLYTTTRDNSVEIEELPTIKADYRPIKQRVARDDAQQDKKIYTYLTSEKDEKEQHVQKNERVISIKELNNSKLTEADKRMILKAFDDLAPNADRRKRFRREAKVANKQDAIHSQLLVKNTARQKDIINKRRNNKSVFPVRYSAKSIPTYTVKKKRSENLMNFINERNSAYQHVKTAKHKSGKTVKRKRV